MINFIRGIVTKSVSTALNFMRIDFTGRSDETISNKIVLQQYGFQSRPNNGAHVVAIQNGETIVILGADDKRYKITLQNGEIAVGKSDSNRIILKANGDCEIKCTGKFIVNATGDIDLGTSLKKLLNEDAASKFNQHTHAANGDTVIDLQKMKSSDMTTKTKAE